MLGDDNYLLAKKVIVIYHHQNDPDLAPDLYYKDAEASSSSEMIARFLIKMESRLMRPRPSRFIWGLSAIPVASSFLQ